MTALREVALRLDYMIGQVTPAEIHWQDGAYDRDSVLGRELLFLIANNDWIRATSEIVDIARSDTIETTIDIDIDLSLITHEAFRDWVGQIWLPIAVLPPLRQELPDPDPEPFSTLTVTDASGSPLMTLPRADVRHRIAAALSEIILTVAATLLPDLGNESEEFNPSRDHELLLSAAIYRLLRGETVPVPVLDLEVPAREVRRGSMPRIDRVRNKVGDLLNRFSALLDNTALLDDTESPGGPGNTAARQLTERALQLLSAFADSAVVVIPADRRHPPTVLTVRLPGRALHLAQAKWPEVFGPKATAYRRWARSRGWRRFRPGNWILPSASLHLDLLLPSADADRQIRVNLPDGISPDPSLPLPRRAGLDIRCDQPLPMAQLVTVTHQLGQAEPDWPSPLLASLADLAAAKADEAWATLRDHHVGAGPAEPPFGPDMATVKTRALRDRLTGLSSVLGDISAQGQSPATREALAAAWQDGSWLGEPFGRRTSTDTISPGVVAARARMIEAASQRSAPTSARMEVQIAVTDSAYYSTARLSGWINTLLMIVVLAFFPIAHMFGYTQQQVSAEVLALILTLFAAIQVGRIERADRSTMRGLLVPAGNPLIITSILPAVVLAGALAFSRALVWAMSWAAGCIIAQLLELWLMWYLKRRAIPEHVGPPATDDRGRPVADDRRRPAADDGRPRAEQMFYTDSPDYAHDRVLHSSWWRRTTAEAVMAGRTAYGYVVWQHRPSETLDSLLLDAQPASMPASRLAGQWLPELRRPHLRSGRWLHSRHLESEHPDDEDRPGDNAVISPLEQPANVLALQRAGTSGQLLNFAVFRDKPKSDWDSAPEDIVQVDLDPSLLTLADDSTSLIGIFAGFRPTPLALVGDHPITAILGLAARCGLVVREIQLPFPAPHASYRDLQWARIELNVPMDELGHVLSFIDGLRALAASTVIGIQASPDGIPRILDLASAGHEPGMAQADPDDQQLVLATDLDVVTRSGVPSFESPAAMTWRVMALCTDWRAGVQGQTLARLDPGFHLAGLTSAVVYGKSVMLVLGHQPDGEGAGDDGLLPATCFDRWLSRDDLGAAAPNPLLRVRLRAPNRPGATLEVLESLREAITQISPGALAPGDWNVWYARAVVSDGHMAHVQLTIMLPVDQDDPSWTSPAHSWGTSEFSRIERRALRLLARRMTDGRQAADLLGPGHETPPDTIIRVGLVTMPDGPE